MLMNPEQNRSSQQCLLQKNTILGDVRTVAPRNDCLHEQTESKQHLRFNRTATCQEWKIGELPLIGNYLRPPFSPFRGKRGRERGSCERCWTMSSAVR